MEVSTLFSRVRRRYSRKGLLDPDAAVRKVSGAESMKRWRQRQSDASTRVRQLNNGVGQ
jgi:hypothetical protein